MGIFHKPSSDSVHDTPQINIYIEKLFKELYYSGYMNQKSFIILSVIIAFLASTVLYFSIEKKTNPLFWAASNNVEWKKFSWNGDSLSFRYPSHICYDNIDSSSCHAIAVVDMGEIKAIAQVQNSNTHGGGYIGEYITPIFNIYYVNSLSQEEAENYLRSHAFPEVQSWNMAKGKNGEVSVATFANNSKIHAVYSNTLSTLVAFMNNTDMACLIDCSIIENAIYHGIMLDGVKLYP